MNELDASTFPLSGHKVIEASAGTGKTYTITNLYLRLLLGDSSTQQRLLKVNEILVLTFTNAATDELRHRIRQRVIEARALFRDPALETGDPFLQQLRSKSTDPQRDSKILTAAVQLMDEASIYTIHGFCARVLNEQPFETGMLFDQQQDADGDKLLELACEDFFRSYIQILEGTSIEIAIKLWPQPDSLFKKIKPLTGRPDITLVPAYSDITNQVRELELEIQELKTLWVKDDISKILMDCGINRASKTFKRIAPMEEYCQGQTSLTDLWQFFTSEIIEEKLTKTGTMPNHKIFAKISTLTESLHLFEQIKTNLWHDASQWVSKRVDQFKENLGGLTQDDLLSKVDQAIIKSSQETGNNVSDLAQLLARRWPVAMIDEFQDTDSAQYRIFNNIYTDRSASSLFMIGDPKQAIYQFRGADIYTYINAKRQVNSEQDLYSLGTNWRSSPGLIRAVNHLFNKTEVFSNDKDIPFLPVESPPGKTDAPLLVNGKKLPPMEIFTFVREGKTINKPDVLQSSMAYTANEIVRLLDSSQPSEDGKHSVPDIAILVRDKIEMSAAKAALDARGIRSVFVTQESVFESTTASDLLLFLNAVAEPGNIGAIRAALATRLCQCTAKEIDEIGLQITTYQNTISEFENYHDHWAKYGISAMIGRFIDTRKLAQKWLCQLEGDREITNLRHLGELLQNQSMSTSGMHGLIQWFNHERIQQSSTSLEDRQLRLDTDSELIKLVTMHASKGLEYEFVFIPMATISTKTIGKDSASLFHKERNQTIASDTYLTTIGSPAIGSSGISSTSIVSTETGFTTLAEIGNNPNNLLLSKNEAQAENMRLLYVAITRAKHRCYLGIAPLRGSADSPIATLLGLNASLETDSPYSPLDDLPKELFTVVDAALALESATEVQLIDPGPVGGTSVEGNAPPPPMPKVTDNWRTHSYTGISRLLSSRETTTATHEHERLPGYKDDDQGIDMAVVDHEVVAISFDQYQFPKGPKIGVALHDLLENLDFTSHHDSWTQKITKFIQRVGITEAQDDWAEALRGWLVNILSVEIPSPFLSATPFSLREIDAARRLNELEFFFPLDSQKDPIKLLIEHGYLENDNTTSRLQLQGVMNGYVDLIVEDKGKYYIIDYKSNMLGIDQHAYSLANIEHHMSSHRYHLQYLIYCVAVNRYLATRIPNYDYDQHFGGVQYLFLRGMQAEIPASGVFSHRPDKALTLALDHCLMNGGSDDV